MNLEAAWRALRRPGGGEVFEPGMLDGVPEPGRRFLRQAIVPGTRLSASVELKMTGRFRTKPGGAWLPMRARQILSSEGFIWKASIGGAIRFSGYDSYFDGQGEMRWKLWGAIPFLRDRSSHVSRSSRGRLAAELVAWLPSALLPRAGASWAAIDQNMSVVTLAVAGESFPVTLSTSADGSLERLEVPRWGNPMTGSGGFSLIPFGGVCAEPRSFGGYRIPASIVGGWRPGTAEWFDFFVAKLTAARYFPL